MRGFFIVLKKFELDRRMQYWYNRYKCTYRKI